MQDAIILSEGELAQHSPGNGWPGRAAALLRQQKSTWDMLRSNYASLEQVRTRAVPFDGIQIQVQFNSGRITSASAKVDPRSIRERKCFLCPANLPPGQRGMAFEGDYLLLGNPFPILPEHFTIPHREHIPQRIGDRFATFLSMSRSLGPDYTVFYNGPACGASAPDHLHFQAGTAGFMPIETELDASKQRFGRSLADTPRLKAWAIEDPLRRFVVFESRDADLLAAAFSACHAALEGLGTTGREPGGPDGGQAGTAAAGQSGSAHPAGEPMMNILALHGHAGWQVILFPRGRHRPSFFFAEDDRKILLSPGAVDMAGLCITPRESDFERITPQLIVQLFGEVSLPPEPFRQLAARLEKDLQHH